MYRISKTAYITHKQANNNSTFFHGYISVWCSDMETKRNNKEQR